MADLDLQVIAILQGVFDAAGWLGVTALLFIESATGLSPGEVILSLAGWMLLQSHGAPPSMIFLAGLYAALGSVAGTSLTYWLARLGGRPLVERAARWLRVDLAYIRYAEAQFKKWGPGLVLFGRIVPGIRILIAIPAGLARMPYLQYLVFSFIGAYLWCTALIGIGYTIGHELPLFARLFKPYLPILIAAFAILALLGLAAHRYLRRRILAQAVVMVNERKE